MPIWSIIYGVGKLLFTLLAAFFFVGALCFRSFRKFLDANPVIGLLIYCSAIFWWFAPNLLNKALQSYTRHAYANNARKAIETMGGWERFRQDSETLLKQHPYNMLCTASGKNLTVSTGSTNLGATSFVTNHNFLPPTVRVLNPGMVAAREGRIGDNNSHAPCLQITILWASRWRSKGLEYHVFPESVSGKYIPSGGRAKEIYKNIYQVE